MSTLEKFAKELKDRREEKGISINDVYEITRIDKNYLQEMENGNFEIMPDVYMRAFIRKYADAVELNPEGVIKKYEIVRSGKSFDSTVLAEPEKISEESDETDEEESYNHKEPGQPDISTKQNNVFLVLGSLIVVVLLTVLYFVFIYSDNQEIIVENKVEDILTERSNVAESSRFEVKEKINTPKKESIVTSVTKGDSLTLKINALDTVWLRTKIDMNKKGEFILKPNRSKIISAESRIDLLVGNTGGIEFILNDKKIDFKGKKGEIRNITIDINGVHYSKIKKSSEK